MAELASSGSFHCVWRKCAPDFAQDDNNVFTNGSKLALEYASPD